MAKKNTVRKYIEELKQMIEVRTGAACEPWLLPQIRATASNMVILDKVQAEIESVDSLVIANYGSMGQQKSEVNPLLAHYDKMQRTLMMQFETLGLNYSTTPSKVTEDTKKGIDTEKDGLSRLLSDANDRIRGEIPDL